MNFTEQDKIPATKPADSLEEKSRRAPKQTAEQTATTEAQPAAPQDAVTEELELKLRLPASAMARFKAAPQIRSLTKGRATTSKLENVYYDTPDDRLAAQEASLRVRKKGRSYEQTIKIKTEQKAGLFKRLEWDKPLSSLAPVLLDDEMPDAIKVLFEKNSVRDSIGPRFMVKQTRTKRILDLTSATAEMALDTVEISTPSGRKHSYHEVEFELMSGAAQALYDLALELVETYGLTLSHFSKAEEGLRLLKNQTPKGVKLPAPTLTAADTVHASFQRIVSVCSAQIMANEEAIMAGSDIEGVHQIRVALRRLRSGFTLFRPALKSAESKHLSNELKWLASSFGDARDTDVFLSETLPPVLAAHDDHLGLQALKQQAKALNSQAYKTARDILRSPRYTRLMLSLARWNSYGDWHAGDIGAEALLRAPITGFANQLLNNRYKKVMRLGRRLQHLSIERKHDLRLLVKKFRYATDFFSQLYPAKKAKPFHKTLAGLQDSLGALNDIAVAGLLVQRLAQSAAKKEHSLRDSATEAAGIIIGWHNRAAQQKVLDLAQEWAPFSRQPAYWPTA